MAAIDDFDRAILDIMQVSNRSTSESISEQVGLSPATVQRRIKYMRDKGVIAADVSVVSQEAVGRAMTFIVHISLERERSDLFDQFKKRIRNSCQIQQCYYVTGNADFILVMTAATMQDYEEFANAFFFDDSNVRSFHTYVVMQKIKTGQFVPAFADENY